MKKLALITVLAACGLFLMASMAFALVDPYVHGDFATNSKGCADCHVTHAAVAQKLLNAGNGTQTSFCIACHGNGATGSPFDVFNGLILEDASFNAATGNVPAPGDWDTAAASASYAGGFNFAYNFGDTANPADGTVAFDTVTSMHNVRGSATNFGNLANITSYQYDDGDIIPGSNNIEMDFECGSCHDPHAGGTYNDDQADKNPRLLKEVLPASGDTRRVQMVINQSENMVTRYTSGFNDWCGGCHDIFNTTEAGSGRTGYDKTNGRYAYMHKFGVTVDATKWATDATVTTPYKVEWMPLENSGVPYDISCITCHRAHGSSAEAQPASWDRYDQYKGYDGTAQTISGTTVANNAGSGSALLRLKQRDVCYYCHGAAEFNHDVTH